MQKPKLLNLGLGLLCSFVLFSCGPAFRMSTYFNADKMVPADFNPKKQILLVVEFPQRYDPDKRHEGYTKKMDDALRQNYPYKYEIVSRRDILEDNPKYSDTSVYKYAVLNFMAKVKRTSTTTVINTDQNGYRSKTSVSPSIVQTTSNFHFYDRNSGKNYPGSEMPSSNLKQEITEFVKAINRSKNVSALR